MFDYEEEVFIGKLKTTPNFLITSTGKQVCKCILQTTEEDLSLIAWEEQAFDLKHILKGQVIEIKGYRN